VIRGQSEDAIRVLEEEWGISAERHRRFIDLIEGVRGDPLAIALRAVGLPQEAAPVAARAATTAVSVTVVWQPPDLVVIRRFAKAIDGARYQLTGILGPHDYAVTCERPPGSLIVERWPSVSPPPVVQTILTAVGLNSDGVLLPPEPSAYRHGAGFRWRSLSGLGLGLPDCIRSRDGRPTIEGGSISRCG
jgi:hypothetical protein